MLLTIAFAISNGAFEILRNLDFKKILFKQMFTKEKLKEIIVKEFDKSTEDDKFK